MTVRFADMLLAKSASLSPSDRQDFVVRKRRPVWHVLAFIFLGVLATIVVLSVLISDLVIFLEVMFAILVALATYVFYVIQQSRDLVLATEFQNSLFSAALSHSNKFCIIVKNDNNIAYMDRSMQEMFPSFHSEPRRGIDVLLDMGRVTLEDRKMIFAALERRVRDKVIFDITDQRKKSHRIIMSLEPITRPKGFMLMRGHEFVEKRVLGPQVTQTDKLSVFNKNNLAMFSYIMDSMDLGAYMIDLFGNITYANLTLEQWLDFEENEMIASDLSLKDIISQSSIEEPVNELKGFQGDVMLQRKIGGHVRAYLTQKAMYNEQGNVTSYTGFIQLIKDKGQQKNNNKNGNDTW